MNPGCVLLLWGATQVPQPVLLDRVAAVVDREVITQSEVEHAARVQLLWRGAGPAALTLTLDAITRDTVLNLLIAKQLVLQDARRRGRTLDVDTATQVQAARFRRLFEDEAAYTAALHGLHLTEADWLEELRQDALVDALLLREGAAAAVAEDDVTAFLVAQKGADASPENRLTARGILLAQAREKAVLAHMERLRAQASIRVPPELTPPAPASQPSAAR